MKTAKSILLLGQTIFFSILSICSSAQETWYPSGPSNNTFNNQFALQASISKLALSYSDPNTILAGTTSGELYKSTNAGNDWTNISLNLPNKRPVKILQIHPQNNKYIYLGTQSRLFFSEDNGENWQILFELDNMNPRALYINQITNATVFTTEKGTFYSANGINDWFKTDHNEGYDIISIPENPNQLYLLKRESSTNKLNLVKSENSGVSFSGAQVLWDQTPIQNFISGKLTISEANTNKIFIYLSGNQSTSDNNNLGLWVFERDSETLTRNYIGAPYNTTHPNLLTSNNESSYVKGFEYINIAVNPSNENEILFGSINLFSSLDGGLSFAKNNTISQYAPAGYYINVRDIASKNGISYLATDGGLYKSSNFFKDADYQIITENIQSANCYDFAHAWHKNSFVSSAENIGSFARRPNYQSDYTAYLGGIENTFTAMNLYHDHIAYNKELNTIVLPNNIGSSAIINSNYFKLDVNSNKLPVKNTQLCYHPNRYNIAFTGQAHQLMRSSNGGNTFQQIYNFDPQYIITEINIDRRNPNLMYLILQSKASNSNSKKLMRSTDGAKSWYSVDLPSTLNDKHLMIAIDANQEGTVYICSKSPSNGSRIYKSSNKGDSWQAISLSGLPNQFFHDILFMTGYNNGLILCTESSVYRFYENQGWKPFNAGLPEQISISKANYYYKEGILKISSYGKGLWSVKLEEQQIQPKATLSIDKVTAQVNCVEDAVFKCFDFSMVQKEQYAIQWHFEDGNVTSQVEDYKKDISFDSPGVKTIKLSILNKNNQVVDIDSIQVEILLKEVEKNVTIEFENTLDNDGLDESFYHYVSGRIHTGHGGFGNSNACFWLNNKLINSNKKAIIPIATDLSDMDNPYLEFDIAYSQFACIEDVLSIYSKTCAEDQYTINTVLATEDLKSTEIQKFNFVPTASQWKKISIPLSNLSLANRSFVYIEQMTPEGNNLFIDNISIINY